MIKRELISADIYCSGRCNTIDLEYHKTQYPYDKVIRRFYDAAGSGQFFQGR